MKIKKSIVVLGVTLTVLSSSMSVFAASCLNVRDYGCHRYNHRDLGWREEERVATGGADANGRRATAIIIKESKYGQCVCGAEGKTGETRVRRVIQYLN